MKLYLVQHGEAVGKDVDPQRPLSEQGAADVLAMAAFLRRAGVRVERVWHSGKRRAEQTADALAKAVLPRGAAEAVTGVNPNDSVEEFAIDADVWEEDTLVVGHLPFMAKLVSLLLAGDSERESVHFDPGTAVCLERLPSQAWVVNWVQRPDLLGDR